MTTPAPVVPTPVVNGVKPTPANGAPVEPAKPAPEDARLRELEAQVKKTAFERMKLAKEKDALAKEKQASAKERAELEEWKTRQADKKRNPMKYMEAEYGKDFYEKMTEMRLSGVPTPDLLASELDDATAKLRKEFEEKTAALQKQLEERDAEAAKAKAAQEKSEYESSVLSHLKSNAEKYKLVTALGEEKSVLRLIEEHFNATAKQDEEGNWSGELLTAEQACELMEKHYDALAEKFGKAKTPAPPAPTPTAAQRTAPAQRTAQPTNTAQGPIDDRERMKRAIAAATAARVRS